MQENLPFVDYQYPDDPDPDGGIAIIGEAPGAEEVRQGKPFVGRSGQLLDKNLKKAGIERSACLVANVFRYQPPGNKVAHFFISERKAREMGRKIARELGKFTTGFCLDRYAREIEHLREVLKKQNPRVIITLGATPLWALTGLKGIVALRGVVQTGRLIENTPVIPTFHPSYILRGNWAAEPLFQQDLEKARQVAEK